MTKLSDYAYYSDLYYKSKEKKERGITFTAFGVVLSGVSIVIVAKQKVYSNANIIMGSAAYIVGGVFINVGIPKWISNTVKENNNRAAMETCRKSNISLNYGITENGIGLILKF